MTINDLYFELNKRIPASLSCDWDNDGIMCMSEPERQVKRVLLTLDVTEQAVKRAVDLGFDLIISHHPLIFHPLKSITDGRLISLIKNGVGAFAFHTRLDIATGGVNNALAELLKLKNVRRFGEDGLGAIGELEEETADTELGKYIKNALNSDSVKGIFTGRTVKVVAVLGGAGGDYVCQAYEAGADFYLSGEIGYNKMLDQAATGMSICAAGHYFTEQPVLTKLEEMIKNIDKDIEVEIFQCNEIKEI